MVYVFEKAGKVLGEEAELINGNYYWRAQKGNTLKSDLGKVLGMRGLKDVFDYRKINIIEKVLKKMG